MGGISRVKVKVKVKVDAIFVAYNTISRQREYQGHLVAVRWSIKKG